MRPYNTLTIDLEAVRYNVQLIRSKLPPHTRLMPMMKAEGYGTDAIRLTRFLMAEGIDIVGVSHPHEAIRLRKAFPTLSIFVVQAPYFAAREIVENELEVTVSNEKMAAELHKEALKKKKRVRVHLDINTGMHRFGCKGSEVVELARALRKYSCLDIVGAMTHFIGAETANFDLMTRRQIEMFEITLKELKTVGIELHWCHAANSAGILRHHLPFCNMARVGIGLLGIVDDASMGTLGLKGAVNLTTQIVGINECSAGESVGYLAAHRVSQDCTRIAVLAFGYFDGLHLGYSSKGYALIRGQKAPYVGRLCMDFMMVDVTHIEGATVGDSATLFDQSGQLSVEKVSEWVGTNPRELLVTLGPRVMRKFVYGSTKKRKISLRTSEPITHPSLSY